MLALEYEARLECVRVCGFLCAYMCVHMSVCVFVCARKCSFVFSRACVLVRTCVKAWGDIKLWERVLRL